MENLVIFEGTVKSLTFGETMKQQVPTAKLTVQNAAELISATGKAFTRRNTMIIKAFGNEAEDIQDLSLRSGDEVRVEGKLLKDSWVDARGDRQYLTYIMADEVSLLKEEPVKVTQTEKTRQTA